MKIIQYRITAKVIIKITMKFIVFLIMLGIEGRSFKIGFLHGRIFFQSFFSTLSYFHNNGYYGRILTAESLNNVHKYKIYYETKYRKENKETENNMSC